MGLADLIATCPPPAGVSGSATGGVVEAVMVVDGTGGGLQQQLGRFGSLERGGRPGVRVRVRFAGPGVEADDLIERMLEERARRGSGPARGCLVVSSDKRVQAAARGVHARFVPSEVFLALLAGSVGGQAHGTVRDSVPVRPSFASEVPLDRESTRWWMRFLEVDEGWSPGTESESVVEPARSVGIRDVESNGAGTPEQRTIDRTGKGAGALTGGGEAEQSDPLLREAMRMWGDRFRPSDLEMSKWLNDDEAGGRRSD